MFGNIPPLSSYSRKEPIVSRFFSLTVRTSCIYISIKPKAWLKDTKFDGLFKRLFIEVSVGVCCECLCLYCIFLKRIIRFDIVLGE